MAILAEPLFLATIPIGLLFAWLGALESTTGLHLLVAAIATACYLGIECLGDHAALMGVSLFWRASYFVARLALYQSACFFVCLFSFSWQPAPNFPPDTPTDNPFDWATRLGQWFSVVLPYVGGFLLTSIVAWIANLLAAVSIRRARWLLIVTTLPGALSILLLWWTFFGQR